MKEGGAELLDLKYHALQRKLSLRPQSSLPSHVKSLDGIVSETLDRLSQGNRIRRWDQQPILFMLDQLGDAADTRCDDG
jgi:hypothetical protein